LDLGGTGFHPRCIILPFDKEQGEGEIGKMSSATITEIQGDRIISLLEEVITQLRYIQANTGYLDRLPDIANGIDTTNSSLKEIDAGVSLIEGSLD
jgi:hypothetical protein